MKTKLVLSIDGEFEVGKPLEIKVKEDGKESDLALLAITYLANLTTSAETTIESAEKTASFMRMLQKISVVLNASVERDSEKEKESIGNFIKEILLDLECDCEECKKLRKDEENVSEN